MEIFKTKKIRLNIQSSIVVEMDGIIKKISMDKILDKLLDYAFDRNIFYHNFIDSYYSGEEPSFWREIMFYSRFLVLIIIMVKTGISTLYPGKLLLTPLTDATILFGKQAIFVNAIFFSLSIVTLSGKLVLVYYESKKKLKFFDIVYDLKARKQKYQMSQKHIKKITSSTWLIYYGYIRITGSIILYVFTLSTICVTIGVNLYYEYGNVIILWMWTITMIYTSNQIIIICLFSAFFFYLPITLLNYRFDELIDKLRVSIRWNNTTAIHRIIKSYDELISDCKQLSGPYNMMIGLVYCLIPYVIALQVELMKIDRNDLLFKTLKIAFIIFFIITNVDAFIINRLSASITVRNKSIHKYLYPMFCSKRIIKIRTKLTIDSFIARLNTQFIGFYCFNLFKFTKMAFYQYAFTISTCYFLIINVIKKQGFVEDYSQRLKEANLIEYTIYC